MVMIKGVEKIKQSGKVVAIIIRNDADAKGLRFLTDSSKPFQAALHSYTEKRETNVHKINIRKPVHINEFHKFIYIKRGNALVQILNSNLKLYKESKLLKGDSIIILNTSHKLIFSKGSRALEIKQGPYESDT